MSYDLISSSVSQFNMFYLSPINNFKTFKVQYSTNAFTSSNPISISASPDTLSSVPHFLKQIGFTDTQIKLLISKQPKILSSNIHKTLKPKFTLLQQLGFSGSSLADLVISNPSIPFRNIDNNLIPTINSLRSLLHSNENIVKALKRCSFLFSYNIQNIIGRNIDILRQCGVPDQRITYHLLNQPRFYTQKPDSLIHLIERVEELGVTRDSPSFIYAIHVIHSMSEDTLNKKFKLYKSYGWSESDILVAFKKTPNFLTLSEEKARKTMSFLMDDLGYEHTDIALVPNVLNFSLENRLKPRSEVLKILDSNGLLTRKPSLYSMAAMSEKKFLKTYVVKFVHKAQGLQEAYQGSEVCSL